MKVVEPVQAQLIKYSDMLMSQLLNSFKCKVSDLLVANYLFYCCHCPWLDLGQCLSHDGGWGHVWRPGTCDLVSRLSHTLIGISHLFISCLSQSQSWAPDLHQSARRSPDLTDSGRGGNSDGATPRTSVECWTPNWADVCCEEYLLRKKA